MSCGTWKANETITAIGTASSTQKTPMMLPQSRIDTKTNKGLTHNVFHIMTGTKNFSSNCCMIVYKMIIAKTPRRPEKINQDIAAGKAQVNKKTN